ncbi:MAG TPA: mercuric transporter MerT family protein [Thermoanaerobaculia bacterium]|nr:mercuric transporter MerT family protein [Thermoanaerobaculia bacterium]
MEDTKKDVFLGIGAVLTAFGASLCCILPIAVAVLGVGSAALAAQLEPLRPWLAGLTVLFSGFAFYRAYKPEVCAPGENCTVSAGRRRNRIILWIVALIAVVLMAFPYYASWLFRVCQETRDEEAECIIKALEELGYSAQLMRTEG